LEGRQIEDMYVELMKKMELHKEDKYLKKVKEVGQPFN
jgi:hypothetical protein